MSVDKIVNKYEKDLFTDYQEDKEKLKVVGIEVVNNNEYLFLLDKYINWVCENRIKGTPDTFIEAACLMYCLIKNPRIKYEELGDCFDNMFGIINYRIAWDVALEIISEPTTYYEDKDGKWLPKKHEKVEIVVPEGLIDNNPLYKRILSTIFRDYLNNEMDYYIMQFSNMLHLIYLNCKK